MESTGRLLAQSRIVTRTVDGCLSTLVSVHAYVQLKLECTRVCATELERARVCAHWSRPMYRRVCTLEPPGVQASVHIGADRCTGECAHWCVHACVQNRVFLSLPSCICHNALLYAFACFRIVLLRCCCPFFRPGIISTSAMSFSFCL